MVALFSPEGEDEEMGGGGRDEESMEREGDEKEEEGGESKDEGQRGEDSEGRREEQTRVQTGRSGRLTFARVFKSIQFKSISLVSSYSGTDQERTL